jgi:cell wall-associated NlpC family hydrolase
MLHHHVNKKSVHWKAGVMLRGILVVCAAVQAQALCAQTDTQTHAPTDPPVVVGNQIESSQANLLKPLQSNSKGLTPPPAMPPFAKPILSPSEQLIQRAKSLLGIPYKFAGSSPETGFDCSGLIRFVFREVLGISLPGRAEDIGRGGEKLSDSVLSPGDLVFFNTLNRPLSHVGIYLGNRQFLHSPATGGVVRIESMSLPYWSKRYQGARRMVSVEDHATTVRGVTPELAHGAEVLVGNGGNTAWAEPVRRAESKQVDPEKSPDQLDAFLKRLTEKP